MCVMMGLCFVFVFVCVWLCVLKPMLKVEGEKEEKE